MEITLHAIYLPIAVTVITWAVIFLWPQRGPTSAYDFTAYYMGFFWLGVGIIVTLLSWLLYFAFT